MAKTEVPAETLPVRSRDAVGRHHAGARIALRRTQRDIRPQLAGGVDQPGTFCGEQAGSLSGNQHLWQDLLQFPRQLLALPRVG